MYNIKEGALGQGAKEELKRVLHFGDARSRHGTTTIYHEDHLRVHIGVLVHLWVQRDHCRQLARTLVLHRMTSLFLSLSLSEHKKQKYYTSTFFYLLDAHGGLMRRGQSGQKVQVLRQRDAAIGVLKRNLDCICQLTHNKGIFKQRKNSCLRLLGIVTELESDRMGRRGNTAYIRAHLVVHYHLQSVSDFVLKLLVLQQHASDKSKNPSCTQVRISCEPIAATEPWAE